LSQYFQNSFQKSKDTILHCPNTICDFFGYIQVRGCGSPGKLNTARYSRVLRKYHIVGDINLYNREELAGALGMSGKEVLLLPDSLLVLLAYEKWGYSCPAKLIGDFAFTICDIKKKEVFATRDHVGVRSFYYTLIKGKGFFFSDSIKGLFTVLTGSSRINSGYIKNYLFETSPDHDATVFIDIKKLPPGYFLLVKKNFFKKNRYWDLSSFSKVDRTGNVNYPEKLSRLVTDAIHCRIKKGGRGGVLLSGGLDSSAIACIVANLYKKLGYDSGSFVAVSRVFKGKYKDKYRDEREYADAIVKYTGMSVKYCHNEIESPLNNLSEYYYEKHTFPPNPFFDIVRPVSKAVGQMGGGHVVTGFGGDEGVSM